MKDRRDYHRDYIRKRPKQEKLQWRGDRKRPPKPEPVRLYGARPQPVLVDGKEILTPELTRWALDRHDATYGRPERER